MARVLKDEEKKLLLNKLKSAVVATRFSALKFITTSIVRESIDFSAMEFSDPKFTKSLLEYVKLLAETDSQSLIRKEGAICLENLSLKLRSGGGKKTPDCEGCGERLSVAYKHCPKCGVKTKGQHWLSEAGTCEECGSFINKRWKFCVSCGVAISQEEAKPRIVKCPFCAKDVQSDWSLCPYCGSRIKLGQQG